MRRIVKHPFKIYSNCFLLPMFWMKHDDMTPLMPEISRVIGGLITGVKVFEAAKNESAGLKQRILDIDIFNVDSKKTI